MRVLVTGGPTRAHLDDVRYISNHSTGTLGVALVRACLDRSWEVLYARGVGSAAPAPSPRLRVADVETVWDLETLVRREVGGGRYDAVIHAMAVLDFVPAAPAKGKRPSAEEWVIRLMPAPKVISLVRDLDPKVFLVGFKLEAGVGEAELVARALESLVANRANLVIANRLEDVRGGNHSAVIVSPDGNLEVIEGKELLAGKITRHVAEALSDEKKGRRPGAAGKGGCCG